MLGRLKTPKLILVSPKGSANVGSVARLMGNFDLEEMRVVEPRCELFSRSARMMGLKNHEILTSAKVYDDFESAQADLHWTVALSMRPGSPGSPFVSLVDLFRDPTLRPPMGQDWGFVFGREDNGLESEELRRCSLEVCIPTSETKPSINLASAVAMSLFQYHQHLVFSDAREEKTKSYPPKADEEVFFESLARLLEGIDFVKAGNTQRLLFDLRDMYRRAEISARDLRILFGVLSDLGRRMGRDFTGQGVNEGSKSRLSQ